MSFSWWELTSYLVNYLISVNVLISLCWKTSQTMTPSSTFRERERERKRGEKASILELVDLVSRPLCTNSFQTSVWLWINGGHCGTGVWLSRCVVRLRACLAPRLPAMSASRLQGSDRSPHSRSLLQCSPNLVALERLFSSSASQLPNL